MRTDTIKFHLSNQVEQTKLESFCDYFEANAQIWKRFKLYAYEKLTRGRRVGARAIFERIRWDDSDFGKGPDGFKVNNLYTKYYAMLLTETDPAFDGFFNFRGDK